MAVCWGSGDCISSAITRVASSCMSLPAPIGSIGASCLGGGAGVSDGLGLVGCCCCGCGKNRGSAHELVRCFT